MGVPARAMLLFVLVTAISAGLGDAPSFASPYPIPLFDLKLPRPVSEVSSLNSGSRLLAVEVEPGTDEPVRVLSIDKRGRVSSIDELTEVTQLTVPGDRLWITGEAEKPAATPYPMDAPGRSRPMPVTGRQVYLSGSGETYAVVYKTKGGYYELRYKDRHGRLLLIATPKDGYGLKTVFLPYDGSRVLVVDESSLTMTGECSVCFGQRLCFYNKEGRITADYDQGGDLDGWLDTSGSFMARDGSYFITVRGMGQHSGKGVVLFDGDGKVLWERSYFKTHRLTDDFGGTIGVAGGSLSLLSFLNLDGTLKTLERKGYGFDFWLSGDGAYAYIKVFKPFDAGKSGVPEEIKTVFPGANVVSVDLYGLVPEGGKDPGLTIAPDGKAFIHYCSLSLGPQESSLLTYYDTAKNDVWHERFYHGAVTPQFVDNSRGFLLLFGSPATRLIYYETR